MTKNLSTLDVWFQAARPKTLAASIVPVIVGAAIAFEHSNFNFSVLIAILAAALCIQVATNLANDYFDFEKGADTPERTGPLRVTQAGLVTPQEMRSAIVTALGLAVIFGLYLVAVGGTPIFVIGVLSLCCAVLYTAGPYPLAYLGLGDIFVFIFFGPVAVGGTHFLFTGYINTTVLVVGAAVGFLTTAILVVNNLRDIKTDAVCGKKTLAVRFGAHFSRVEYLLLTIAALSIPLWLWWADRAPTGALLSLGAVVPATSLVKTVCIEKHSGEVFNTVLAQTGKLLFIWGGLLSLGWLIL